MAKYRKKPVVIEAITFDELSEYSKSVQSIGIGKHFQWTFIYAGHTIVYEEVNGVDYYLIPTLEGTMRFGHNDMLITGVNGEIYPCNVDIFQKTYETVED